MLACLLAFFSHERIEQTSSSVNEWNTLLLHLWTKRTYFFISGRMKRHSSSSSSMNERNSLFLHLWTNRTHFFISGRMERPSSSSCSSSMNEWNALFLRLYERIECTSSSSMNEWNALLHLYGQMNHSDWLIDWLIHTEWLFAGWMYGWMIPLKLHLLGLSSLFPRAIFITIERNHVAKWMTNLMAS